MAAATVIKCRPVLGMAFKAILPTTMIFESNFCCALLVGECPRMTGLAA